MTVIVDPANVDLDAGIIIAKPDTEWVAEYDKPCETCDGWPDEHKGCWNPDCRGSGRAVFQIGYRCDHVIKESGSWCYRCDRGVVPLATVSITEVLPIVSRVGYKYDPDCFTITTETERARLFAHGDERWVPLTAAAEPGDLAVFVTVHERHDHRKDEHP